MSRPEGAPTADDTSRRGPVTLVLLGDVMLGRGVARAHADGRWETALADLAPSLRRADLALANLESPLTRAPLQRGAIDLRADPASALALSAAGLDLLSMVNNHALDSGAEGLNETREALRAAGLTPIESVPRWRTVDGVQLALVAFEDVTAPLDLDVACRVVAGAHEAGGVVVVSLHWGGEYRFGPSGRQRAVAQALADCGASLIWGHHPHVVQPVEWVQGRGQRHPMLAAYSLGNALFDQPSPPAVRRGLMLAVTLDSSGVRSAEAAPIEVDVRAGRARMGERPSDHKSTKYASHARSSRFFDIVGSMFR